MAPKTRSTISLKSKQWSCSDLERGAHGVMKVKLEATISLDGDDSHIESKIEAFRYKLHNHIALNNRAAGRASPLQDP